MYIEFTKLLTVLVCTVSLVEVSLGCGNRTRQKRQDGLDFADMAAAGVAVAVDLLQQGAAVEKKFKFKIGNEKKIQISKLFNIDENELSLQWKQPIKGEAEFEHDFSAGTGEAFKVLNGGGGSGSNGRRKRSTSNENAVLQAIFRAKRQIESNNEPAIDIEAMESNEKSMFQRIKEQFNRVVDAAQGMYQKLRKMARSNNDEAAWNQTLENVHRLFRVCVCVWVLVR